jgi:hypothetical protein
VKTQYYEKCVEIIIDGHVANKLILEEEDQISRMLSNISFSTKDSRPIIRQTENANFLDNLEKASMHTIQSIRESSTTSHSMKAIADFEQNIIKKSSKLVKNVRLIILFVIICLFAFAIYRTATTITTINSLNTKLNFISLVSNRMINLMAAANRGRVIQSTAYPDPSKKANATQEGWVKNKNQMINYSTEILTSHQKVTKYDASLGVNTGANAISISYFHHDGKPDSMETRYDTSLFIAISKMISICIIANYSILNDINHTPIPDMTNEMLTIYNDWSGALYFIIDNGFESLRYQTENNTLGLMDKFTNVGHSQMTVYM